jgi:purine-binding chemotaxis protein CheW
VISSASGPGHATTPASPADRDRELLRERARRLARPLGDASEHTTRLDAVSFSLGRERYAVAVSNVFAVFRLSSLTPLPGARAPVIGLTQWRGDVLTVLDVRGLVGAVTTALDDLARVIVLGVDRPEFGLLADRLDDPLRLDAGAVFPLSAERASRASDIVRGITSDAVVILDAPALVARQSAAADPSLVPPS